ncbi:MAG: papain-like cysteine protease family protein [Thermoanaerobaculia bacterium]
MATPAVFEKDLTNLFAGPPLIADEEPPRRRELKVTVPSQKPRNNWCWAAVAVGIAHAYGDTKLTLCKVASCVLHPKICCAGGSTTDCDSAQHLSNALKLKHCSGHDHFQRPLQIKNPADDGWALIVRKIDDRTPIAVRIGTGIKVGHFIVVKGYDHGGNGERQVIICDPKTSSSTIPLSKLNKGYLVDGTWTHTYETKGDQEVPEV